MPNSRIDVHYHLIPPELLAKMQLTTDMLRSFPSAQNTAGGWSPAQAVDILHEQGLSGAVVSFAGVTNLTPDTEKRRHLARVANDYFAELRRDNKGVFGLFAGLPSLSDVDGSLDEIRYSLDTLGAEGMQVFTSYDNEKWLGDPVFEPVWEELNRRRAVVHVHPTVACSCARPPHISLELPFDTGRTTFSMWQAGVFDRFPDIHFIFCHGGGPVPMLIARFNGLGRQGPDGAMLRDADVVMKRQWYDTAQAASYSSVKGMLALADPKKILFGTDIPLAANGAVQGAALADALKDDRLLRAIEYDNVVALMPTMAQA